MFLLVIVLFVASGFILTLVYHAKDMAKAATIFFAVAITLMGAGFATHVADAQTNISGNALAMLGTGFFCLAPAGIVYYLAGGQQANQVARERATNKLLHPHQ